MSIEYIVGVIVGILVAGVVLWLIARKAVKTKTSVKYDERQTLARAQAYSVGFFTILLYCVFYALLSALDIRWCEDAVGMFLGCFCGITAFVITAIRHDAYFGINEDAGTVMKLGAVIVFFCLVGGIISVIDGKLIEDGLLTGVALDFAVCVMWLVIIITYKLHSRKAAAEEADEE